MVMIIRRARGEAMEMVLKESMGDGANSLRRRAQSAASPYYAMLCYAITYSTVTYYTILHYTILYYAIVHVRQRE